MGRAASATRLETELPLGQTRAALEPATIDRERRTVEVTWTTGARVRRQNWWDDEPFLEELSLDEGAVDLGRLQRHANLLASHQPDLEHVLGVVEEARLEGLPGTSGRRGVARVRFSSRADVDPIWEDVQGGIIRNISVGYITHELEEQQRDRGEPRLFIARRWEPVELSLVAVGADAGAQVRSEQKAARYPVVITRRSVMAEESPGAVEQPKEPIAGEPPAEETPVATEQPPAPSEPAAEPEGTPPADPETRAERSRVAGILHAVRCSGLEPKVAERLADDHIRRGTPLVEAQRAVFSALARQQPQGARGVVEVGTDGATRLREGIVHALLRRVAPATQRETLAKLPAEQQRTIASAADEWRGLTLLEIGREYLRARGVTVRGTDRMQLAAQLFGLAPVTREGPHSFHTTSDFPTLLATVGRTQLAAGYQIAPRTFPDWTRQGTLPDFRPTSKVSLGLGPKLLKIQEHGEYTRGPLGLVPAQSMRLEKYGRILAFTREAMINDDVELFQRIPALFGQAAAAMESDIVYDILTSNPLMADGVPLFHATHGNLMSPAPIDVNSVAAARAAMMQQKSPDGQFITVMPRYLICGPAQELYALQFLAPLTIVGSPANAVPTAYQSLVLVVEPRITDTAWYLAADPNQIDTIEYDYLEAAGAGGPTLETREGWDIDGQEYKAREEFAAAAIDFRGLVKNPGQTP